MMSANKDKRNELEKKQRWHSEEIQDGFAEKLKAVSKSTFGNSIAVKMFSSELKDLQKWLQLFKSPFKNEELVIQFVEVLDYVLKWAYLKSNEIKSANFLKKLFIYFDELLTFLIERNYQFTDTETNIFCSWLIEKLGINNNILKEKSKDILIRAGTCNICHPKKVFGLLINGLSTKNSKMISECLEWIAILTQSHQHEVIKEKSVQLIAKLVDNPDNGVRQSALSACEEIYKVCAEQFWIFWNNKLTPKAEDIIKARFKATFGVSQHVWTLLNISFLTSNSFMEYIINFLT